MKKSSLSRKISSIRVFYKFLKKKGHIEDNPALLDKESEGREAAAQVLHG